MRISLVTLAAGSQYRRAVAPGLKSKQQYCERHGYEFVVAGDEVLDNTRPPAWSKIRLLQRELPRSDWVFLSDADVVIMNHQIRLEDLIEKYLVAPEHHIAVCLDMHAPFSTGNMLLQNHPWTFEMLEAIWDQEQFINELWWEQAAFLDLHRRNVLGAQQHVNIAAPREFNSLPARYGHENKPELTYEVGDFLVHHANTWSPRLDWHMRFSNRLRRIPAPLVRVTEKFFNRSGLLHHTRSCLRRFGLLEDG